MATVRQKGSGQLPDGNLLPELRFRAPSAGKRRSFDATVAGLPTPYYSTDKGRAYLGDALEILRKLPERSLDLIVTSPPFALIHKKAYGNEHAEQYLEWFRPFAEQFHRVLKNSGSLVIELGGTWQLGRPVRSLYQFSLLLELAKTFQLAQEFYYFNNAKLPTPAEWVTVRRCRLKDAVNTVWWLSKTDKPKANNRRVLYPYGADMERLIKKGYNAGPRPSEHNISRKWQNRNPGSIAPNILVCSNTLSSDPYLKRCKAHGISPHPARFPPALPRFFIRFLTEIGDVVMDPFGGSNVSGMEAEGNNRFWIVSERDPNYIRASAFRFGEDAPASPINLAEPTIRA